MLIIAIKVNESDKALAAAASSTSSTKQQQQQQQQQLLFQVGDRGRILTAYCILTFTL